MNISYSLCKQAQTLISFPGFNTSFNNHSFKDKVVIVLGATGTGKSRLSIDLAKHYPAEIVNSDKIQVYKGLDIVTNKVSQEECRGVPHHLLGIINDPNFDYNRAHFRQDALIAIDSIIEQDKLPIIAGGSNSFIESLVHDDPYFKARYDCCFLWVDVSLPILEQFVSKRVDQMVKAGFVDEVRGLFNPKASYTQGIRRAIGVPELDCFLRAEEQNADQNTLHTLLEDAIKNIKHNTCRLAYRQVHKIHRLREFRGWKLHHINATEAFLKQGKDANEAWERVVLSPSMMIVMEFLLTTSPAMPSVSKPARRTAIPGSVQPTTAMAAAIH